MVRKGNKCRLLVVLQQRSCRNLCVFLLGRVSNCPFCCKDFTAVWPMENTTGFDLCYFFWSKKIHIAPAWNNAEPSWQEKLWSSARRYWILWVQGWGGSRNVHLLNLLQFHWGKCFPRGMVDAWFISCPQHPKACSKSMGALKETCPTVLVWLAFLQAWALM